MAARGCRAVEVSEWIQDKIRTYIDSMLGRDIIGLPSLVTEIDRTRRRQAG